MADAIVSIALERLAGIMEEKIREEIGLVRGVKKEVRSLSSKLTAIRNVLEDAEKRGFKEKSIQNWLNKLEDISYDVDDTLDEWNYAILKLQIEGSETFVAPRPKVCSFIPSSCFCFKKVATHHNIAVKIKGLKERLDMIVKEKDQFDFIVGQAVDHQESEKRVRSTSSIDVEETRGRGVDKDILVSKLILESAEQESGPDVVSIVGTGGIGKTTVAQLVYNDDRVINCFKLRIWICVSDVFDEVRIAKGIVEIVTKSSPNVSELEALLKCVTDTISGKRFLLVLDDVWTEDYNKWKPFKNSLKCGGPGSKILVTTRSKRVARMMGTIEIHPLGKLSVTDCWLIMQRIAFSGRADGMTKEKCEELSEIGKNIADKCGGMPLAAMFMGSLLCFKDTVEGWENVLNSKIWELEEAEVDLFPHLLLSYNELSPAMKRCFSHCSIFPKDSKIDVKKLIGMWTALGYLGSSGSLDDLELKGREYFDTLKMRSFFQDFWKGDETSCKMHDIVHDFAQFLTKRKSHDSEDCDGRVEAKEQGSCQASDPSLVSQIKINRSLFCPKGLPSDLLDSVTCLRALSLFKCGLEGIPGYIVNLIHLRYLDLSCNRLIPQALQTICKLYKLQTLCLRECKLEEIPRELGNLIQLRCLDLSLNTSIMELPETICNLQDLETLNLEDCINLSRLPKEINKLINLRHLPNDSTIDLCQIPQGFEQLTALRTLRLFHGGLGSSKLGYLKKLNQLSGSLELRIYLHGPEDVKEAQKAELRNKKHIKCLKIWFHNGMWGSDRAEMVKHEAMEALQPPPNLQQLTILDYEGTKFPNWITSFLNHLKVLNIQECNYCSSLPPLWKLPCLEELSVWRMRELKVLNREFLGIEGHIDGSMPSSAVVIGFPKLKKLSFRHCFRWKEWEDITAEEAMSSAFSIMPCLRELNIIDCSLTALPHLLLSKASALKNLKIEDCFDLSKRYEDKNGSDREFLSHIPHVKVEYIEQRAWALSSETPLPRYHG